MSVYIGSLKLLHNCMYVGMYMYVCVCMCMYMCVYVC